jgi:hypothetical protein
MGFLNPNAFLGANPKGEVVTSGLRNTGLGPRQSE